MLQSSPVPSERTGTVRAASQSDTALSVGWGVLARWGLAGSSGALIIANACEWHWKRHDVHHLPNKTDLIALGSQCFVLLQPLIKTLRTTSAPPKLQRNNGYRSGHEVCSWKHFPHVRAVTAHLKLQRDPLRKETLPVCPFCR